MKNTIENFLNPHNRRLKKFESKVAEIIDLEDNMKKLSDDELKNKTIEFRERLKIGQTLDSLLVEAFAVVREASYRVLGMKHYPVQLIGGMVLHEGSIAQMNTGEGKTLVSTPPSYLNALCGEGVYIITVNDYLSLRDKQEMGQIHEFLGLTVGYINRDMNQNEKKLAYACDITYGTNSEFGFDYLRDNMALNKDGVVQRKLNYAIIDEVDSILIDEARTPLIITTPGPKPSGYYVMVDKFIRSLKDTDYEKNNEKHVINLTDSGMDKVEKVFAIKNISDQKNVELLHHIRQSLHAHYMMQNDQDYVLRGGEILIVDKFTGRVMEGRRFSNGLHQAIEAKENVDIQKESRTCATITYQNYFRMFDKISGMTGTAYTEKEEFAQIYGMDTIPIPTNKPVARIDYPDSLYKTKSAKLNAIVDEVEKKHKKGQPVLLGTVFIDDSEILSRLLNKRNIKHNILNAKQDKSEADIIAMAGQRSMVTIATNMAGRGTDIKIDDEVLKLGGLCVIGSERHESRRIDNQLRGRAGRQGDSGESKFFISLEDTLFSRIDADTVKRIIKMIDKLNMPEDEAIEDKVISRAIESVQKNIEGLNYSIRKNTLEFDEILNKQRQTIYQERNRLLNGEDTQTFVRESIKEIVDKAVDKLTRNSPYPEEWDLKNIDNYFNENMGLANAMGFESMSKESIENMTKKDIKAKIIHMAFEIYDKKLESFEEDELRYYERMIIIRCMDSKWIEHLDIVEQIRQGMNFQHVGGKDPIKVFNEEAFELFEFMIESIKEQSVATILSLCKKVDM